MAHKTLIVLAHLDDEVLSCGGLIQRRLAEGGEVYVWVAYGRGYAFNTIDKTAEEMQDFMKAKAFLGYQYHHCLQRKEGEPTQIGYYSLLETLEVDLRRFDPDEVIIPSPNDLNQDHRFLHDVCRIALRSCNLFSVKRILVARAFDVIGENLPTYYVPLSSEELEKKLQSIALYGREARSGTHPRSPENIRAAHQVWGARCGRFFAEPYDVYLTVE